MRTLKKVLALSLVFAMAFTMMAGAAFKDQDKIDPSLTEDIQLLTALGVFQGDENGNFNPTDNVKRSEAAKMIYVLKNNGVDDGAVAFQGVSKYSDVPVGHWAEGYINYCTNLGYMGGWQENGVQKFDPNGNVTGVELMKMLLCMIGYKADVQGYTGNGWQTNVLVDAATSGLSVEFVPSVYGATPRQWTARLMVNAINAPYVSYNNGQVQFGSWNKPDMSYGEQYLGLTVAKGTLTATNNNKLGAKRASNAAPIEIGSSMNDSNKVTVMVGSTPVTAVGDADENLLGLPVKMFYKKAAGANQENKLYAVMPYSEDGKIINTTVDAVKYDSTNPSRVTVEGVGTRTYGVNNKVDVYMNNVSYMNQREMKDVVGVLLGVNANLNVTLVLDKDGYITTALIHDMVAYAQVNKIDAEKNVLSLKDISGYVGTDLVDEKGSALIFDNASANMDNFDKYLNVASDVKAGSIVKIVANTSSGKLVYDITLADKIEATPTGYALSSDGSAYATLSLNGETVKKAVNSFALSKYTWDKSKSTAMSDTTFYTDGKYVVFSEGGSTAASMQNMAYIIAKDESSAWGQKTYKVKVLLADGTIGEYPVAATYGPDGKKTEVKGAENGVNASLLANVKSYSIADGKITLRDLGALTDKNGVQFKSGTQKYDYDKKLVTVTEYGAFAFAVDPSAYFFVKSTVGTTEKYSVVKASDLTKTQTSQGKGTFAYKTVNGVDTLMFGTLIMNSSLVTSDVQYAYVTGNSKVTETEGKWVLTTEVRDQNAEVVEIKRVFDDYASAYGESATWNGLRGKVVTYELDSNGNIATISKVAPNGTTSVVANKWNGVEITGWSNNIAKVKVTGGSVETLTVASDVKIHFVDQKTGEGYTTYSSGDMEDYVSDSGVASAYAYVQTVNGNNVITDIFVERDGESIANIW